MKKTLQLLFFSALSVGAMAQHKANVKQTEGPKAVQKTVVSSESKIDRSQQFPATPDNRVVVFHETFENDFSGSTELGGWTFQHYLTGVLSTQGTMWSIGTPSYQNAYGGAGDALTSATPTKWALWDGAAYYLQYPSTGDPDGSFYTGYLNAPEMDFSELESVLVSFQQVFRYCCFPTSPVSVDVSVNGGTTWTSFNALGDAVEGANIQSVNPLNTVVDISCIAAGEENVLIRFAYNSADEAGYTHYYWGIDEVKVYTNDYTSDLFVSELFNGDILADWEFRVTPEEQMREDGMIVGVRVGNKGTEAQDDVQVLFELVDANNQVVDQYETPLFHLYGSIGDTICPHVESHVMLWQSDLANNDIAMGTYTLRATVHTAIAEDPAVAGDNVISETIVFNNIGEYGHDGDTSDDFQFQIGSRFVSGNAGPREPGGWGSHFSFVNPGSSAHGVTVRFGSNTVAGVEFRAALIAQTDQNLDNSPMVASGNYETTASWLTNHNSEPLFFAFNAALPVGGVYPAEAYPINGTFEETETNYVAAIWRQNQGEGQLSVLAQETIDADLSSVAWERGGDQAFHWFHFQEFNYAVRLILSAPYENHVPVGVEEVENTTSFSVYPNPAVNESRVSFNLAESKFIAYEVRDLQGRLMDTDNVGRFGAGQNSFALNVSKYPAGNYIVGLVVDGKQMLTQQISVVR